MYVVCVLCIISESSTHLLLRSPRFIPIFCSYCAIYLWYHSHVTLPGWLLYYHISYCSYNWVRVCIAPTSSPPTIPYMPSYAITMLYPSFDVIDPHYEGLVDVVHWLGFLVSASLPSFVAAYKKPSQWTINWIPHVYCCRVVWYDANIYRLQRGSSYRTVGTYSAPTKFASSIVGYMVRLSTEYRGHGRRINSVVDDSNGDVRRGEIVKVVSCNWTLTMKVS